MSADQVDLPFSVAPTSGRVHGTAAPLMRDFVNTDIIIPATYMRRLTKTGYGDVLFEPWRGSPGFVLDDPRYAGASVLLAGEAFGSGSSREHAPWALRDGGFRAVIAVSFADIFAQNCPNVGLVTVAMARDRLARLADRVLAEPALEITVDLIAGEIRAGSGERAFREPFALADHVRSRLLNGRDLIETTLDHAAAIAAFEATRPGWLPATSGGAEG
jgi:3-isopropylmalate/(R)-2-methylmalate dehydratase small subunit